MAGLTNLFSRIEVVFIKKKLSPWFSETCSDIIVYCKLKTEVFKIWKNAQHICTHFSEVLKSYLHSFKKRFHNSGRDSHDFDENFMLNWIR